MKKFHFSMERLLQLRKHREKEWEIKLGKAVGSSTKIRQAIDDREQRHLEVLGEREGLTMEAFKTVELYMERMRQEAAKLKKELKDAEARRLKIQASYLEASREREVLEKLKERKKKKHAREESRKEFDILDEANAAAPRRQLGEFSPGTAFPRA